MLLQRFSKSEIPNSLKDPNISPICFISMCTQMFLFCSDRRTEQEFPCGPAGGSSHRAGRLLAAPSCQPPTHAFTVAGPPPLFPLPSPSHHSCLGDTGDTRHPEACTCVSGTRPIARHAHAAYSPRLERTPAHLHHHACLRCSYPALLSCPPPLVKLPHSEITIHMCSPFAKQGAGDTRGQGHVPLRAQPSARQPEGTGTLGTPSPTGCVREQATNP